MSADSWTRDMYGHWLTRSSSASWTPPVFLLFYSSVFGLHRFVNHAWRAKRSKPTRLFLVSLEIYPSSEWPWWGLFVNEEATVSASSALSSFCYYLTFFCCTTHHTHALLYKSPCKQTHCLPVPHTFPCGFFFFNKCNNISFVGSGYYKNGIT